MWVTANLATSRPQTRMGHPSRTTRDHFSRLASLLKKSPRRFRDHSHHLSSLFFHVSKGSQPNSPLDPRPHRAGNTFGKNLAASHKHEAGPSGLPCSLRYRPGQLIMGGKKKAGGTKKKPAAKKVQQATTKGKESNTLTANKTVSKEKVKRKLGSDRES